MSMSFDASYAGDQEATTTVNSITNINNYPPSLHQQQYMPPPIISTQIHNIDHPPKKKRSLPGNPGKFIIIIIIISISSYI